MIDEGSLREYQARLATAVGDSKHLLDEAVRDIETLSSEFRQLRPRAQQMVSLASDGGHSRIEINPFNLFIVRVVDSNGSEIMKEVVGPGQSTVDVSRAQFEQDSSGTLIRDAEGRPCPRTPLGFMMRDLDVEKLSQLTAMIQDEPDSNGWVVVFRDLCEWAALYHRLVYRVPTADTVFVKDGLLRTKIFSKENAQHQGFLIRIGDLIDQAIARIFDETKVHIYLAGVAKHSEITAHYGLAFQCATPISVGYPIWAPIPLALQEKVYKWPEYYREPTDLQTSTESPKFNIGAMHFVRFGPEDGDRMWTVDVLHSQRDRADDVLSALAHDAQQGFPVPFYPMSLQKADEAAQVSGFDRDILNALMKEQIRRHLPPGRDHALDVLQMEVDITNRRYG